VALCLAALTPGFGQPKPTSAPGVSPRPLPTSVPQVAPAAPSASPTTATEEAPAAVPPAQTNATPPPSIPNLTPVPDKTVTLQYPNSDVVDVLHLYETLTGKKLIMDNFVQGKVNIFLSRPVPRDEAIKIIEINLLMNGYSLVPAGDDIVKVIGTGRSPRNAGVPLVSDEADIPDGEHVVSFLFKLRYADPVELQQVLGQYLSPPQPYTSFLALPKSSSILITENSAVIRSLIHIVDQIDVPPAQVVSEFIKLQRADASKVVEMLKDVFEKGSTTTTTTTVQPGVRPVRPPANVPQPPQVQIEGDLGSYMALSEDSIVVGKIKIAADVRTNRIHVITRPVNMPFIRKLISEFDANVEFAKPVTRALRYISAAEVLPVIVQILTEPGSNQAAGAETTNPAAPQQQAQQNQRRTNYPGTTGLDSSSSTSGSQNFSEELSTQAVDTTPKAVTIGNAKIIADQRSNSIIVLGNMEVVVKVGKLLDEMDVKAPQVALSTVIGELTLKNDQTFGVDWFKNGGTAHTDANGVALPRTQGNSTFAGASRNTGTTPVDPAGLINFASVATAAATGGTNVFLSSGRDGLAAIVRALDSTGRFRVLNRPVVFTTNNKKAIIASGQEIPVPVNTLSSFIPNATVGSTPINNFGTQSSIQYKKVALQLEVVPLINSEKEVSLDILQKLDSLGTPAIVDGNSIPTIVTRYIKTTVSAPNCSTIVLGGLITDNKQVSKDGIPLLSRIPIIGGLFRNTVRNLDRTELIVLMRPEVALTKLDIYRLRQKFEQKTHIGPEMDSDDCPDCPKPGEDKQIQLPGPDLPGMK
jgi:general secretion pathway protein D